MIRLFARGLVSLLVAALRARAPRPHPRQTTWNHDGEVEA